ncbi:MAG: thioredoxin [Myxococcota bacterium]|jgi:thioredoxin|nr:thioredoxin [Myxococcota bacterium]
MGATTLTAAELKETIDKNSIVLIDFWATWCGPCRAFAPVFDAAANKHADVAFRKVDTEKEQELAAAFGIRSIPTLAVFKEGVMIFKQAGALPATSLEDLISKVKDVEMSEVHAKLKSEEPRKPSPN